MYPPTSRGLVQEFETRAMNRDTNFTGIVDRLQPLQQARPEREFANLQEAIGTNNITPYFPFFDANNKVHPNTFILNQLQRDASGKIKLGLDLQGGTSFLVEMDTNQLVYVEDGHQQRRARSKRPPTWPGRKARCRRRSRCCASAWTRFGVAEPIIQPAGGNRILIQLPGLSEADKESAKAQHSKGRVSGIPDGEGRQRRNHQENQRAAFRPATNCSSALSSSPMVRRSSKQVIVKKKPENGLAGDIVENAMAVRGNLGEPQIDFRLNSEGAKRFGEVTRNNVGQRLAIVLDGELYSAPVIQSAIETGNGQITGHFTVEQAQELANVLQNPLRAPLIIDLFLRCGPDARPGLDPQRHPCVHRWRHLGFRRSCCVIICWRASWRTSRWSPTSSSCWA